MDKQMSDYLKIIRAAKIDEGFLETDGGECNHTFAYWIYESEEGMAGCILAEEIALIHCPECGLTVDPAELPVPVELDEPVDDRMNDPRYDMHLWK